MKPGFRRGEDEMKLLYVQSWLYGRESSAVKRIDNCVTLDLRREVFRLVRPLVSERRN